MSDKNPLHASQDFNVIAFVARKKRKNKKIDSKLRDTTSSLSQEYRQWETSTNSKSNRHTLRKPRYVQVKHM